ncbi:hypothetical protein CHEID_01155 [Corynebacterium heidelbergense]|uniref:hypothetical protein n=2 Tax=Corynebacterium heidelbergense TaxID=2055947 RepID=UPI002358D6E3|nr:hypothetical protein [Corynebacterium heidelbergense]WCZ35809.1 hypothetical protein CHEID_01155 [Corynebacterium heidelbergense]
MRHYTARRSALIASTITSATSLTVLFASSLPAAGAVPVSSTLPLSCAVDAGSLGGKFTTNTQASVTVDSPEFATDGQTITFTITLGDVLVTFDQVSQLNSASMGSSEVRVAVSPNLSLVNPPAGVTLENGELVIRDQLVATLDEPAKTVKISSPVQNLTFQATHDGPVAFSTVTQTVKGTINAQATAVFFPISLSMVADCFTTPGVSLKKPSGTTPPPSPWACPALAPTTRPRIRATTPAPSRVLNTALATRLS